MSDIKKFTSSAFQKLKCGGLIFITEYYFEVINQDNSIWKLLRSKEMEMYHEFGSNPLTPLIVSKYLKEVGFSDISSTFKHLTPTTIGMENFYKTIISYVLAYSNMSQNIFNEQVKNEIIDYCLNNNSNRLEIEDRLFLTHAFGIKK
jgi:hypothetical protein